MAQLSVSAAVCRIIAEFEVDPIHADRLHNLLATLAPEVLDTAQTASRYGVSRETVIRMAESGKLPYMTVGIGTANRHRRFRVAALDATFAIRGAPAAPRRRRSNYQARILAA